MNTEKIYTAFNLFYTQVHPNSGWMKMKRNVPARTCVKPLLLKKCTKDFVDFCLYVKKKKKK